MDEYSNRGTSLTRDGGANHGDSVAMRNVVEYDPETDTHRASYHSSESVGMAIVSTLAAVSETDPMESPPLYSTVDPDALDNLVSTANGNDLRVAFEHAGYRVVVEGGVDIAVTELDD